MILFLIIILFTFNAQAITITKEADFKPPINDLQIQKIIEAFQGRLTFLDTSNAAGDGRHSENLDGEFQVFTSNGVADTEETLSHTLNRTPVGFIIMNSSKGANLYDSGTSWTSTTIYLKSDTASTIYTIWIF